ncbi:unnamed protein product [Orchesella dallaii]|uniref:TFIIS N-terminal domain-containing protein n=1 Tax=Orchesella dallaii TaxID=48710 RepID=A0ABP1S654_9HEXA
MSENKALDVILHCQKQIKKEPPEEKLLHYLGRLSRLRITVQDLAETGIGRTVNQLSRNEGQVGSAAETLVRSWKRMVSEQQNQVEGGSEESDSNSNSESSEDEDEEDDEVNNPVEPYEIPEPEEVAGNPEQQYRNGNSVNEERRATTEPLPVPIQSKSFGDDDDEDEIDDVEDPYLENGYLNMANVHTDDEDDEEDDDIGRDSDTSDRLQIADDAEIQRNERKEDVYQKQDKHYSNLNHPSEEIKDHKSSNSKSHHKSHENSERKHGSSSSKSNHYSERSEKASSSSSSKDPKYHSSRSHTSGESKERPVIKQENAIEQKSYHQQHSTTSKSEKSKEYKSESSTSERSHHKEKERHRHDKHSRESSSHREKDGKSEKERHKDKKDSSEQHRRDKNREASSSSYPPKKSSPEIKKPESSEDRKRRDNSESSTSTSKKSKLELKEEIDSTSGVNFADVLGYLDTSPKNKKIKKEEVEKPHKKHEPHSSSSQSHKSDHHKKHHSPSSSKHSRESSSSSSKKYERDSEVTKMIKKPVHSKIESVIKPAVNISPNYKPTSSSFSSAPRPGSSNGHSAPLPHIDLSDLGSADYSEPLIAKTPYHPSQADALSTMLSSRNARSKVYSGVKSGRKGEVPTLYDLCMQVIKDNIGDLGYTGGIPYDILRPALERANPQQLMNIEAQNDYLIGETDELWQFHCKRDFRGKCPEETESWRELYERCTDEQKRKFEQIKKQMKRSIESAEPVRKAKLAFVDTTSGPRFSKQKAQTIKNGMRTLKIKEEKGPKRGVSSSASVGFNNPKGSGEGNVILEEAVIIAPGSRANHAPAPSVSRGESSTAKMKPKRAPLMQKTMKLIRSLNRR